MNTRNNKRFKETEEKIRDALLNRLGDQDLHDVTVGDICRDAGVNRSTFYAHHDSPESLLEAMEDDISQQLVDVFETSGDESTSYRDRYLKPYLYFVMAHKAFYRAYFRNSSTYHYKQKMLDVARRPFLNQLRHLEEQSVRVQLTLTYYTAGIHSLIRDWVNRDFCVPPDELAEILLHAIYHTSLIVAETEKAS